MAEHLKEAADFLEALGREIEEEKAQAEAEASPQRPELEAEPFEVPLVVAEAKASPLQKLQPSPPKKARNYIAKTPAVQSDIRKSSSGLIAGCKQSATPSSAA